MQGAGRRPGSRPGWDASHHRRSLLLRRPAGAARGGLGARLRSGVHRDVGGGKPPRQGRGRSDRAGGAMILPRVLVVRSGANPFVHFAPSARVEIVEKVSHTIEPVQPSGVIERPCDLVIFTSQVAVERAFGDPALAAHFREAVAGAKLVAVGLVTGEALGARGLRVDLVAKGSAESVLEELPARLDGQRVLLPCGEDAAAELPERLRARGARATRLVLYRKIPTPPDPALTREILERPFAAFCATSPSAGSWLFTGVG